MTEFQDTRLVQRLERPLALDKEHPLFGRDNPFAFGGGLRNGGLSEEAMNLLRDIWRFDYMGSAEFEFGAVPNALSSMAKIELSAFTLSIPRRAARKNWADKSNVDPEGEAIVYVLCPAPWKEVVADRIRLIAADPGSLRLKEASRFPEAIRPIDDRDNETCGWLELNNGFLFFTDETMWAKASALFGIDVEGGK